MELRLRRSWIGTKADADDKVKSARIRQLTPGGLRRRGIVCRVQAANTDHLGEIDQRLSFTASRPA